MATEPGSNIIAGRFGDGGLKGGGGDDTFDPMEPRVAKLEADIEHVKTTLTDIKQDVREMRADAKSDFRILFGAVITVAIGLAGLMGKGFHWF